MPSLRPVPQNPNEIQSAEDPPPSRVEGLGSPEDLSELAFERFGLDRWMDGEDWRFDDLRAEHLPQLAAALSAGADLGRLDARGRTPLAALFESPPGLDAKGGRSLDCDEGLLVAAATLLLDAGADPSASGAFGTRPLFWAARLPFASPLRLLLERGASAAEIGSAGEAPLHLAATCCAESVRLLVEAGAEVDRLCCSGETALARATECGALDCARILLEAGADPDGRPDRASEPRRGAASPLHVAVSAADIEAVELLLEFGADPGLRDASGSFPLHKVCDGPFGQMELFPKLAERLLAAGAEPFPLDASGKTPAEAARAQVRAEILAQCEKAELDRQLADIRPAAPSQVGAPRNSPGGLGGARTARPLAI